jgi:hypothetical protein
MAVYELIALSGLISPDPMQIAGSVKFVPDRPNEIVSGGYDNCVLHFDHSQRTILSKHTFGTASFFRDSQHLPMWSSCTDTIDRR